MKALQVELGDNELARDLAGAQSENFKVIEKRMGVKLGQRGTSLHLSGSDEAVDLTSKLIEELTGLLKSGRHLVRDDVEQAIKMMGNSRRISGVHELVLTPVLARPGGRVINAKGLTQRRYVELMKSHDIVFGIGPAGTGKTYLAMAAAVSALLERRVKRIVLARPAVEAGEKLGFLPGDLAEKVDPYLRPLYDALHDMMEHDRATQLIEEGVIEVAPLAFMRGRTLHDSFAILDEAQNATVEQMKMFLTRLGSASKAVVTGDVTQIDLPPGKTSGLVHAAEVLKAVSGIGFVQFAETDVLRHPLVQEVIRAWDKAKGP
jgi:phosphate starvation-inducible protein PhoH and related proteins